MVNKRGDITSTQIVLIVLAISGFVVVLGFYLFFNFSETSAESACHLSVLTKATVPQVTQGYVPLKSPSAPPH